MAASLPAGPHAPTSEAVERWGVQALGVALATGFVLTALIAWGAPERVVFLPVVLAAAAVGAWLFLHPLLNLAVVLVTYAATGLTGQEGIQVPEVIHGLYYLLYLAHWYATRLLRRQPLVHDGVDRLAALLIGCGLFGGTLLGVLMGAPLDAVRGEALAFGMLLFYFPVREACRRYRYGPEVLLGVLVWFGVFVTLRNALGFYEALHSATQLIEIAGARAALNEMHVLVGVLGALVFVVTARRWSTQVLLLAPLGFFAVGLLITKARGFWVDALFGGLVLFFLLEARERRRFAVVAAAGVAAVTVGMSLLFSGVATLLVEGVAERFSTLGDAAVQDVSLVNRFHEAATVWSKIKVNPLLGYGLGASFTYYNWVYDVTLVRAFVHNGFVALWFKFGLWGLVLMLLFWGGAARAGIKAYRLRGAPLRHRALALAASLSLIAIFPSANTSAPFFVDDSVLSFALLAGLCVGLHERLGLPSAPSPRPSRFE